MGINRMILPSKKKIQKEENKEENIKKLISAGLYVFSEYGFESVSTKQIAKLAKVNEVLIARYFRNKAGLFDAIAMNHIKEYTENINNYPTRETIEEEILSFFKKQVGIYKELHNFYRILISRLLVDAKLKNRLEAYTKGICESFLISRLKKFQDTGEIDQNRDLSGMTYILNLELIGLLMMIVTHEHANEKLIDSIISELARTISSELKR